MASELLDILTRARLREPLTAAEQASAVFVSGAAWAGVVAVALTLIGMLTNGAVVNAWQVVFACMVAFALAALQAGAAYAAARGDSQLAGELQNIAAATSIGANIGASIGTGGRLAGGGALPPAGETADGANAAKVPLVPPDTIHTLRLPAAGR